MDHIKTRSNSIWYGCKSSKPCNNPRGFNLLALPSSCGCFAPSPFLSILSCRTIFKNRTHGFVLHLLCFNECLIHWVFFCPRSTLACFVSWPAMDSLANRIGNLDQAFDIDGQIESIELTLASRLITQWFVNLDALLRVHWRSWTKHGGLELKVVDKILLWRRGTRVGVEAHPMELCQLPPCCQMIVFKYISPSSLSFNSTSIWMQIHHLPIDWRYVAIVTKIAEKMRAILDVDKS